MTAGARSKGKSINEELTETLMDPKVIDCLAQKLAPQIMILMNSFLDDKLSNLSTTLSRISDETISLKASTEKLTLDHITLRDENSTLRRHVEDLLQYTRRDDLILH